MTSQLLKHLELLDDVHFLPDVLALMTVSLLDCQLSHQLLNSVIHLDRIRCGLLPALPPRSSRLGGALLWLWGFPCETEPVGHYFVLLCLVQHLQLLKFGGVLSNSHNGRRKTSVGTHFVLFLVCCLGRAGLYLQGALEPLLGYEPDLVEGLAMQPTIVFLVEEWGRW